MYMANARPIGTMTTNSSFGLKTPEPNNSKALRQNTSIPSEPFVEILGDVSIFLLEAISMTGGVSSSSSPTLSTSPTSSLTDELRGQTAL